MFDPASVPQPSPIAEAHQPPPYHDRLNEPSPWHYSGDEPARDLDPGMGLAVARRTVFRPDDREDWARVARRVALGNTLLTPTDPDERRALRGAIARGALLTSGRHLQHGDRWQAERTQELFTNCSTSATSFMKLFLLLSGSGVGRSYDDKLMLVDWACAPEIWLVLGKEHQDAQEEVWHTRCNPIYGICPQIGHRYPTDTVDTLVHLVDDSREGWARALELWEALAFDGTRGVPTPRRLVLDWSRVRPAGSPIAGMQDRPSSGPLSPMRAFVNSWQEVVIPARWQRNNMQQRWRQAMVLDHYFSQEVQVGGARRAARMSTKDWHDPDILDFVRIKAEGGLWTSNNSVMVDAEFWREARCEGTRAHEIFLTATEHAHRNGEPGWINGDKLEDTKCGYAIINPPEPTRGSTKFSVSYGQELINATTAASQLTKFLTICNPCGEIPLHTTGGFCVLATFAPLLACPVPLDDIRPGCDRPTVRVMWDNRVRDAVRLGVRFLIRVNLMDSVYTNETRRTNRIGICPTGLHEWAWMRWGLGFRDLLDEEGAARGFWYALAALSYEAKAEAALYSKQLGLNNPFTVTSSKPDGCRPWNALTTTTSGIYTLEELFSEHQDGAVWSNVERPLYVVQDESESSNKRITKTYHNGKATVLKIRMSYGLEVECTPNHKWWVASSPSGNTSHIRRNIAGWVEAKDLQPGQEIKIATGVYTKEEHADLKSIAAFSFKMRTDAAIIKQPKKLNPDLCWMLGYLWGDGAMSPTQYRLRFIDQRRENLEKVQRIVHEQFGLETKLFSCKTKDAMTLEFGCKMLWHWLLKNNIFKYADGHIDLIPQIVRESSQEDIIAFIAGLLDSDGAITKHKTSGMKTCILTQASHLLISHVQHVGWAVGLAFGLSHNTCGHNWQQIKKSVYLMTLSAATVPIAHQMLLKHSNKMQATEGDGFTWTMDFPGRKRRRVVGKIESIVLGVEQETYDIEVEDSHWFYAGAIKSHNTVGKLFSLTEGAHLPARRAYLRWVQYRNDDPLVARLAQAGHPVRKLKTFPGMTIVGFPTRPLITRLGMGEHLTTAPEATPAEHYRWLQLLEKYWLGDMQGAQISYTLRVDTAQHSLESFRQIVLDHQPTIRCCSILPCKPDGEMGYEYLPDHEMPEEQLRAIEAGIGELSEPQGIDMERLRCESGVCPL